MIVAEFLRRWGTVLSLAALAGGCTSVESNKAATYDTQPRRLLVLESLGSFPNMRNIDVTSRLVAALSRCDTILEIHPAAAVATRAAIDEAPEEAILRSQAETVERFQPDAVLHVIQARGAVQAANGALQRGTYALSLYDVPSKKTVWKASIDLRLQGGLINVADDPAANLSKAIVARLSEDNILAGCPTKR
jgi:hypothetical protein